MRDGRRKLSADQKRKAFRNGSGEGCGAGAGAHIAGIAEYTTAFASEIAKEAARIDIDGIMVGAVGWVSGMSNAFPREGETLFRLVRVGRYAEAMPKIEQDDPP